MTAPGLADSASVHAPVCAGNNGDFERLGFYKTTKADTAELAKERDSCLLTLGNLAIIPQPLNASIRDAN